MMSEREQLVALRKEIEDQRRRFGGPLVRLLWWPNADQGIFSSRGFGFPGDPFVRSGVSKFAKEIWDANILYPPHDYWGHNHCVPGCVIFDPNDDQPDAIKVFGDLARRVGEFLERLHPDLCENELKPFISSTHHTVRARNWSLAWIFRRDFNATSDDPTFGILADAFGLLIECIDIELGPQSCELPKPHARNRIGKRTLWADFIVPNSVEPLSSGRADGPIPPDGFCFSGKEAFGLTPDESKLMAFVWSRQGEPPTWIDAALYLCPTKRVNGMPAASRDDFNNMLHRLKKKLVDQNWTACIHFAGRGATTAGKLVLREPVKRSKTRATTKRRSTVIKLSKGGSSKKQPTKKKRASNT